jgi:hypothetical protein
MLNFTPTFSIGSSRDIEENELWVHIPSQGELGMLILLLHHLIVNYLSKCGVGLDLLMMRIP